MRAADPALPGESLPSVVLPALSVDFFVASAAVGHAVDAVLADRRLARATARRFSGGLDEAVASYREAMSPDLVVIEWTRDDPDALLLALDRLAEVSDPRTRLMMLGPINDVRLFRRLGDRGVSDYLPLPVEAPDLLGGIVRLFGREDGLPRGRVIAVIGASGGVGTSTVARHLAGAIARRTDAETLLVDGDLASGSVGLAFGQDPLQGFAEALASKERFTAAYFERFAIRVGDRLAILPVTGVVDRISGIGEDALLAAIDGMRSAASITVIDLPHGLVGLQKATLIASDEIVLVATPELGSLRNARLFVDTLRPVRPNDPSPKCVLSMTGLPKRPEIASAAFAEAVGLPITAEIGYDSAFVQAFNDGHLLASDKKSAAAMAGFDLLVRALTRQAEARPAPVSTLGRLGRLIGLKG